MKILSYVVPCYNSAEYMDHCIESLLPGGDDVEIIIVDDGSKKDATPEKADEWERRYPGIIRAVHQENAGHGGAVNTGLANACGLYFKVVDSDDWLDGPSMDKVLAELHRFVAEKVDVDLVIADYVYEHVSDNTHTKISYRDKIPRERIVGWDEVGTFKPSQNLLMHSVIYRTQVLRDSGIKLPTHTFYVDNLFVFIPLPYVKTIYYMDLPLYRYFIGREDQSVNESVMVGRIDQQLRITRLMIEDVERQRVTSGQLQKLRWSYLSMMMAICSIFSLLSKEPDALANRTALWKYLKSVDPKLYHRCRYGIRGIGTNFPGRYGRKTSVIFYRIARRLFKFN